ncbi:MAG: TIGR01777 family oxidoreductase [Dehalococcoidia bacterium]|nr:TIGR01777 family oxidoreductase [Dehalococcoidia bacterium]
MKVIISGSSGFIGKNLTTYLSKSAHHITTLLRKAQYNHPSYKTVYWNPERNIISPDLFNGFDAIIHLGGASLLSPRWTSQKKRQIKNSRVKSTTLVANSIAELPNPPKKLIVASATGFYGDTSDEITGETGKCGSGFLANTAKNWEDSSSTAKKNGVNVINARFGMVLDWSGGSLPLMSLPFKYGFGAIFGSGQQWLSWVSLIDTMEAILFLLKNDVTGPVNIVSKHPISQKDFCNTLATHYSKKVRFKIPESIVRTFFGEMGNELFLSSSRIIPSGLIDAGFKFKFSSLSDFLKSSA